MAVISLAAGLGLTACVLSLTPLALRQHHQRGAPPAFSGTTAILAVPLDGSPPREVARLRGQYGFATDTADGRALLVEKPTLTRTELWRIPLTGGKLRRVGLLPSFEYPLWSADRSTLLLMGSRPGVGVYRTDGTRLRTFTGHPGDGGVGCTSRSGVFVACVRQTRPSTGWQLELEVRRADGTLVWHRPMAFPTGTAAVAPDGRRVVLSRLTSTELVTPRRSVPLAVKPLGAFTRMTWTPDGRSLVYVDRVGRLTVRDMRTGAIRVVSTRVGDFGLSHDGRTAYVVGLKAAVSIPK